MNTESTLFDYAKEDLDQYELPSFKSFLASIRIQKCSNHPVPSKLAQFTYYQELIENIIHHLCAIKSSNVLCIGFVVVPSGIHNPNHSWIVEQIKSEIWEKVYECLKLNKFLQLLINHKGVDIKRKVQLFGDTFEFKKQEGESMKSIDKSRVMYHVRDANYVNYSILNSDFKLELINEIGLSKHSKRMKKFTKLLDSIKDNDSKCNYHAIYLNLLTINKKCNHKSILSNTSSISTIFKFIFVILGKLLPFQAWGNDIGNKRLIKSKLISFLIMSPYEQYPETQLIQGLKVLKFNFGTMCKHHSKQDFEIRKKMLKVYMSWLMKLVCQICKDFWYITPGTDGQIDYFPHYMWNELFQHWSHLYIDKYLTEVTISGDEKFNFGKIRLIPKVNSFRTICIPSKMQIHLLGNPNLDENIMKNQKFEYLKYTKNLLEPVRQLLQMKLNEKKLIKPSYQSTVYSRDEVVNRIERYKKNKNDCRFYMVKFDMKQCFDNMNQQVLFEKIQSLFIDDQDDKPYYFRKVAILDESLRLKKITNKINTNFDSFKHLNGYSNNGVVVDKSKTIKLTKKDIINVCHSQIFNTKTRIYNKWYVRKKGVFQGFQLSSTFCDILYSSLVDEQFHFIFEKSSSDHLLMRLVDDFLFITTDESTHQRMVEKMSDRTLYTYGAYINQEKTAYKQVNFVGLKISSNLTISYE